MINLCDIRKTDMPYRTDILKAITKCVDNCNFILGEAVENFEKEFADYLGIEHAIGVSSCTMALYLALRALDIKPDDEVIIPDFTIAADIEPVLMCNAEPVLCGVDETGNISLTDFEHKITPRTKAIIIVHLYGKPCNMQEIVKLRTRYNIPVIEDCAQAFGAEYNNKKIGTFTDMSCHSFFPSKVLGGYGDGGMIATDNEELAEKIFMLRNHGRKKGERYKHDLVGVNSRLNAIQAAILSVKLSHIDKAIEQRRVAAYQYDTKLKNYPVELIKTPVEDMYDKHVYYMYSVRAYKRDALLKCLIKHGIKASIHYPMALSQHPIYKKYYEKPMVCEAYSLANEVLSLPIFPGITEEQINYVCEKIEGFYEK
jgi:dTDP-4-amino-4,6-dideoxygalactose transaminase